MENIEQFLIGKKEDSEEVVAALKDQKYRVVNRDGSPLIGIRNYDLSRLNLSVVDGIIKNVTRG